MTEEHITVREVRASSIISKSRLAEYAVNPYTGCTHACKYCYASYMSGYTGHQEPWGTYVDVKIWQDIPNPRKYDGKSIFVGTVTDPYQPAEEVYCRTRSFLEQMRDSGARIGLTTKSDLIVRDLDLIRSIPGAHVTFSLNTCDDVFRSEMDSAASVERRLSAMKVFHDAGVPTTCFIAPVMPGITGVPSIILAVRDRCSSVLVDSLNLRGDNRQLIFRYIREKHPELEVLYARTYIDSNPGYWEALDRQLQKFARTEGIAYARAGYGSVVFGNDPSITSFIRTRQGGHSRA